MNASKSLHIHKVVQRSIVNINVTILAYTVVAKGFLFAWINKDTISKVIKCWRLQKVITLESAYVAKEYQWLDICRNCGF